MKIIRYIAIVVLAYIAITLSAARLLVLYAEDNIGMLENYLNANDKVSIQISEVNSNWKGLYPSLIIKINNKSINQNKNIKYPNLVDVKINIYKSIIFLKPIIKSIYVENVYYKSDAKRVIENIKTNKNSDFLKIENIQIANSNFVIKYKNKVYDLKNTNIIIKNNNIYVSSSIDGNKSAIIDIKNIEIKEEKIIRAEYKIKLKGHIDNNFKKVFNKKTLKVEKSNLDILLIGKYEDSKFIETKLDIRTENSSKIIYDRKIIKDLNVKLVFEGNIKDFLRLEIIEANFVSNNNNKYKISSLAINYNIADKNISIYSKLLNINLNNLLNDYKFIKNNNISFSGAIKNLRLKFNLKNSYNNFYVSGDFINSIFLFNDVYIKNFTGFIEANNKETFIDSDSNNVEIKYKSVLRKNLLFDSVKGKIKISNYDNFIIDFYNLKFFNDEINISSTGFINKKLNSIRLISNIDSIDMKYITNYMPSSLMSENTSKYFNNAFKKGHTKGGNIYINGSLSSYPFYDDNDGISHVILPMSKLDIDYKKGWIPFKKVSGIAYFNKRRAHFVSNEIKVLKTSFRNATLTINDVENTELWIKGKLAGPFNDLLKYANIASLTKVDNQKILKIKGNSETDLKIKIDFDNSKNHYESKIRLNKVSYDFDKNNKLSDINGNLYYRNNKFYTEENKLIGAKYNNKNIKFKLETDKKGNFLISGNQRVNVNNYMKSNIFKNNILGSSNWEYNIKIPGFNSKMSKIFVKTKSDLVGTTISLPKPFAKSKGKKSNIVIKTTINNNTFRNINIIYNGIYSEIKSFDDLNGYINFSGKKSTIPNSRLDIVGNLKELDLNDWKKFDTNESSINYLTFINKIDLNITKFKNNKIILENFNLNGFNTNKSFIFDKIIVKSNFVNIKATGKVEFDNISSFKINLNSKNLENLLNFWNFSHSLRDSTIDSNFNISWKGDLFDFALDNVYGEFTTNMNEGRLKKVGNRATRIFGLFNIDLLARRLSLDFDDVTKNGFYFNSLTGDFRIENGNIFTTNLLIKGPSSELLTVGTTNIINETYDMQVVASPEFGETLPAIALLGGPITAAATYAAEKLAKAFGKDINDLVKIKYKVTGTWDKPKIKIMNKKSNALDNVEELL